MPDTLTSQVRWTDRTFGPRPGTLTLTDDRLSLASAAGEEIFAVPSTEGCHTEWPKWGFDSAFRLRVDGRCYSVTFIAGASSLGTWSSGMKEGAEWKARLIPGFVPSRPRDWIINAFVFAMVTAAVVCGLLLGLILVVNPDSKWYDRLFGGIAMFWAVGSGVIWIVERRKVKRGR